MLKLKSKLDLLRFLLFVSLFLLGRPILNGLMLIFLCYTGLLSNRFWLLRLRLISICSCMLRKLSCRILWFLTSWFRLTWLEDFDPPLAILLLTREDFNMLIAEASSLLISDTIFNFDLFFSLSSISSFMYLLASATEQFHAISLIS